MNEYVKLIVSVLRDNNYKLRRNGVIFFKKYLSCPNQVEQILESSRWESTYLPELIDLVEDEDLHIRLDTIEALAQVLDKLTVEQIKEEYMETLFYFFDPDNHNQIEMVQQIAKMSGLVAYKLNQVDLLMDYKKEFIDFFKLICDHSDESIRMQAVYNLPCMYQLFKKQQDEIDLNFGKVYQNFQIQEKKLKVASLKSVHEAFLAFEEDEDASVFR